VTKLGEFSPNGWLFALGSCMKIREVALIFWPTFSGYALIWLMPKFGLGLILSEFFTAHLVTLLWWRIFSSNFVRCTAPCSAHACITSFRHYLALIRVIPSFGLSESVLVVCIFFFCAYFCSFYVSDFVFFLICTTLSSLFSHS
jgi:hypothetical protein